MPSTSTNLGGNENNESTSSSPEPVAGASFEMNWAASVKRPEPKPDPVKSAQPGFYESFISCWANLPVDSEDRKAFERVSQLLLGK